MTADLLIQGVHFDLRWTTFYALGYKALAVNLSDIAAMGGQPAYLVLSLGIPVDFQVKDIEQFYRGVRTLASEASVAIVGGDLSADQRFTISGCLIGYAPHKPISRSGARVGDDLYVTGTLGDSALGLHGLKKSKGRLAKGRKSFLTLRHLFPQARVRAGAVLAKAKLATAMIDVSDGLLQDLGHLCAASGTGAVIWSDRLPLSLPYRRVVGPQDSSYALTGGEDYELLFSLRAADRVRLARLSRYLGVKVTRVGQCVPAKSGITVLDGQGKVRAFSCKGYDHFKGKARS